MYVCFFLFKRFRWNYGSYKPLYLIRPFLYQKAPYTLSYYRGSILERLYHINKLASILALPAWWKRWDRHPCAKARCRSSVVVLCVYVLISWKSAAGTSRGCVRAVNRFGNMHEISRRKLGDRLVSGFIDRVHAGMWHAYSPDISIRDLDNSHPPYTTFALQ